MTVSSVLNKMPTYAGNGVTYLFPYTFKVNALTDIKVYKTGVSGNPVLLTSGYVVIPNDPQDFSTGGHVQYPDPLPGIKLATGEKLTLIREVPFLQTTNFKIQGTTNTHVFEEVADKNVMMMQQLNEKLNRSMVASVNANAAEYTLPDPVADQCLIWNAAGTGFINAPNPGAAVALAAAQVTLAVAAKDAAVVAKDLAVTTAATFASVLEPDNVTVKKATDAGTLDGKHWVTVVDSSVSIAYGGTATIELRPGTQHNFYLISVYTSGDFSITVDEGSLTYYKLTRNGQTLSTPFNDFLTIHSNIADTRTFYYKVLAWE